MEGCSPFFGPEGDPSGTVAGEIEDRGYAGPFCGLD